MYVYSNDGLTFFWRDPGEGYQLKAGEVSATHELSRDELTKRFPGHEAARAAQQAAEAKANA